MSIIGSLERRIDLGLALALPSLVVVSCLLPLLGLALGGAPSWLAPAIVALLAVGVGAFLLRGRGVARSAVIAVVSVAAGSGLLALVLWGLSAMAGSQDQALNDLANTAGSAVPLIAALLAVAAIVLTFRALPARRIVLAAAWVIAVATPFALATPVGVLSDRAGNAGMDVVGLYIMPLAAVFVWVFLLAGSSPVTEPASAGRP